MPVRYLELPIHFLVKFTNISICFRYFTTSGSITFFIKQKTICQQTIIKRKTNINPKKSKNEKIIITFMYAFHTVYEFCTKRTENIF